MTENNVVSAEQLASLQLPFADVSGPAGMEPLFDRSYVFVAWLSWVPNVVVVELALRRSGRRSV